MRLHSVLRLVFGAAAVALLCLTATAQRQPDYCYDLAQQVLQNNRLLATNVVNMPNSPSCFIQANQTNPDAMKAIAPTRTSVWNAFESLSGSQQQGSSLSSSASTNAVSKPSGPTSLVEEFGGVNATSGSSALTFQWSPGTLFANLAVTGVLPLCLTDNPKTPSGCVSSGTLKALAPLTFKVTGSTSSGSGSVSGTASSPGSSAPAQPINVSSAGTSGPGFSGLTVQYSFYGSRAKAAAKSLTSQTTTPSTTVQYYVNELKDANQLVIALDSCDAYANWQKSPDTAKLNSLLSGSVASPTASQVQTIQVPIEERYRALLKDMLNSQKCQPAIQAFSALFAAILEAKTYEDFVAQQSISKVPEIAIEYDLNTPQNKPSYSSAKATLTWSFGGTKEQIPSQPTDKPTPGQQNIRDYAKKQVSVLTAATSASSHTIQQTTANAKSQAQANVRPWSLTLNTTADIYNAQPPSSVPSGTHLRDIQGGAEIAYLFSPSKNSSALRTFIGSVTAAAAYSYQDQTSPAILTGPALTDFTGLPSSTTSAYAKRGPIHLGQAKLGFGTGSNITFPVAFTYSNRTELVLHPTWGLQFGVSYNLTSLFSSSGTTKPASSPTTN